MGFNQTGATCYHAPVWLNRLNLYGLWLDMSDDMDLTNLPIPSVSVAVLPNQTTCSCLMQAQNSLNQTFISTRMLKTRLDHNH